jgi:transcriptional regulator with XRE-family HTH domain
MALRDWSRLARYVRERRDELGLTQEEVAGRGGPSTATIRLIEGGEQESYRPKSLRQLAEALEWTPESPLAILNGREPVRLPSDFGSHRSAGRFQVVPDADGQSRDLAAERRELADQWAAMVTAPVGPELKEVRAAIEAAPPGASGSDIFPDKPALAEIWDMKETLPQHKMLYMAVWLYIRRNPVEESSDKAG